MTDKERGAWVLRIRTALGDNQAAFAKRLKINQATVSRWESGLPMRPHDLGRLSALATRYRAKIAALPS